MVGGTSIGAIIGTLPAMDRSWAESDALCRQSFTGLFDPTLPLVSLLTGRRIGTRLASVLGDVHIEDLPIPYFCVSTNLSRAEVQVHRSGPLVRAVRASISLPGVLPPVAVDGDLHVDGGLLDNLPIEIMASESGGEVIAVDVSPEEDLRFQLDLALGFSGWRALGLRLNPFVETPDLPTLSTVLMRSVLVASLAKERERRAAQGASLYLRVPVEEWGLLEFERLQSISQRGYEACLEPVKRWWQARGSVS
jgi:NTE family protein/lysophospholipid hydrolase